MPKKLIILAIGIAFIGATYLLGWSSFFSVKSIEVIGAQNKERAQSLQNSSGIVIGSKLARVEPRAIAAHYLQNDWVASSKISRNWLNGKVTIELNPRIPIAIYQGKVIDREGKLFSPVAELPSWIPSVAAATPADALTGVQVFRQLPENFQSKVSEIKVGNAQGFVLVINENFGSVELRLGKNDELPLKIKVYEALITRPENAKIKRIDLSAPHSPIVK